MKTGTKRLATMSAIILTSTMSATLATAANGPNGHMLAEQHAAQGPNIAVRGMHYARFTRVCGDPQPHRYACFAIKRTTVHLKPGQAVPAGVVPLRSSFSADASGANGGYSPSDLEALYNFSNAGGGGQTVGIVDWYDDSTITNDLNAFDQQYGFAPETPSSFEVLNENGRTAPLPSTDASSGSSSIETSLDVEAVRAACAQCKIVLVEANQPKNSDIASAENTAVAAGAKIVSNSFGSPEADSSGTPTFDQSTINAFNHPGVAILASTGDDGWYSWDFVNNSSGPAPFSVANFPSTLPSVVSVGGTFVGVTSSNQRAEGVWNENGAGDSGSATGATGGGCSELFYAPGWQSHMKGYSNAGCNGSRLDADVSAIGDPATGFDYYDTDLTSGAGWGTVGGTSLASPFIAGMWADAGGPKGIPYPGLTLYANAATHPSAVHDITYGADLYDGSSIYQQGSNAFCGGANTSDCLTSAVLNGQNPNAFGYLLDCSWDSNGNLVAHTGQCDAERGFDGPSGIGTPNGLTLFKPQAFTIYLSYPRKIHAHRKGAYKVSIKDPAPGGRLSKARVSWGDHKSSTGSRLKHTYKKAGRYVVKIVASDNYGITHTGYLALKVVR